MMIDPSWTAEKVKEPRGAVTYLDATDIPKGMAAEAINCEFRVGQVRKRAGFGVAMNPNIAVAAMKNWISGTTGNNILLFQAGTGLKITPCDALSVSTIGSTFATGVSASFADAGERMYATFVDSSQTGIDHGQVVSKSGASFVRDNLFPGPMTYTPSAPTEPAAGRITKGTHYLGYVIEYRHGFFGRACPDSGSGTPGINTFQPVSFTAAGAKNLSWTLNTTWPTGAVAVHVIMTPATNRSQWFFVPGAYAAVTGGSSSSVAITFSISDDELYRVAQEDPGTDATSHLLLYTQTTGGTSPFDPRHCFTYGDRMVYLVGNRAYVSERNNYQAIFPDTSLIQVPGQRDLISGCFIGSALILFGDTYTYATSDSGNTPSEWQTPQMVDGQNGSPAVNGVDVNVARGFAWVASKAGLFMFDGSSYGRIPISYYQTDLWNQINWDYAYKLRVVDWSVKNQVFVFAPVGSTPVMKIYVWSYWRGTTPDKVDFSEYTIGGDYAANGGAIVVNNLATADTFAKGQPEMWLYPEFASQLLRQKWDGEANVRRDGDQAQTFRWTMAPVPSEEPAVMNAHFGVVARVVGSGSMTVEQIGLDGDVLGETAVLDLAAEPSEFVPALSYNTAARCRYSFRSDSIDGDLILSDIAAYYTPMSFAM